MFVITDIQPSRQTSARSSVRLSRELVEHAVAFGHKLLSNAKVKLLKNTVDPFAGWTNDQIRVVAPAIEMEHAHGNFANEPGREIIDALRAEAASRHLPLPVHGDFEDAAPDNWMT